jgi:MarR family 2-MHQ and catechol resistance regulon transcriptional repressor
MMKAMRVLTRYAAAGIEETGLGFSDFAVLEVLLHKRPLPVNTIVALTQVRLVSPWTVS